MKQLIWTGMVLAVASCAVPPASEKTPTRYQCDNGMQISLTHQDQARNTGTLTLSQVAGGNVEARSIAVNRIPHPSGAAWSNAAEQIQWVESGSSAELTYPVGGVVRLFACHPSKH